MTLATYTDLQTQVGNWLARADLAPYIPDMITLFEAAAARKLKVRPMETTATIATTNGVGTLPTGFLGWRRVTWTGSPRTELNYVHPQVFTRDNQDSTTAPPIEFTVEGGNVKVYPIDDTGLEMLFDQKTGALSSALNWLYTNHPDAYLFGTLAEANFFNRGSALTMAATWLQRRDAVFDEIQKLDFNERQSMSIRIMGSTP